MTTEPKEVANDIVRGVISWDWESGSDWDHHYERLVDALAAAIEYRRAKHAMDRATARGDLDANHAAYGRAQEAGPELDAALVALGVELGTQGHRS